MGKKIATAAGGIGGGVVGALGAKKAFGMLNKDSQGAYFTPQQEEAIAAQQFFKDYDNQQKLAQDKVTGGLFTKDLFGQGGLQSQLATENADLASRGYSLTQGDREAYGQVAGDIARQYGQEEQGLAQALARRGLASGASGAAIAGISGAMGNKLERLGKAQTDIAQRRVENTTQRLAQTRSMMSQLANQGVSLRDNEYGNKAQSFNDRVNVENIRNNAGATALANQQAAYKPSLLSSIGQGLQTGVVNLATAAPGMAVGGATGGASGAAAAGGQNSLRTQNPNMISSASQPRTGTRYS